MLRKLVLGLALAGGVALPLGDVAQAAIGDGVAASNIASQMIPVEKVQYVYGGQNYCFYDNGWHGPGYYYCGYAFRTGLGWGGGIGWNNWGGGGWHGGVYRGGGWHGGVYRGGGFHGGAYRGGGFHGGGFHGGGFHGGGFHGGGGGFHRGGGGRRR